MCDLGENTGYQAKMSLPNSGTLLLSLMFRELQFPHSSPIQGLFHDE